jgi:hypothetical protein
MLIPDKADGPETGCRTWDSRNWWVGVWVWVLSGRLALFSFRGRVSPRRATHFLLLRQKKVSKEKATPLSATPSLRYGATCGARVSRGPQNSLRSDSCGPDPRNTPLLGAARGGWRPHGPLLRSARGANTRSRVFALNQLLCRSGLLDVAGPSAAKACPASKPFCMRRGAERFADQGSPLFERSEFGRDPAKREHRRLPRSAAKGSQTVGSPFFCLRFFGEAKKSRSPAGARPGLWKQTPEGAQPAGASR